MKREYKKVKEYEKYVLYIDEKTGIRECFLKTDLRNGILESNKKNNSTGIVGVCLSNGLYQAYIYVNGEKKHLGVFKNLEDAIKVRKEAEIMYKGKLELNV